MNKLDYFNYTSRYVALLVVLLFTLTVFYLIIYQYRSLIIEESIEIQLRRNNILITYFETALLNKKIDKDDPSNKKPPLLKTFFESVPIKAPVVQQPEQELPNPAD